MGTFDSLFKPLPAMQEIFGKAYNPPDHFEQGVWYPVVERMPADLSDGNECTIEEMALPARFFRLRVLDIDGATTKLALSTGSGDEMARLVKRLAEAFCDGMIGIDENVEVSG